ncbi:MULTISPECIES: hypothetical protein [unclassified Demequina]|nr:MULTISPECIES: hypothetical protein [unclassified Demequina]
MRHSTGRRVGRTFGWLAVTVVSVLALGAGILTGAAIAFIEGQR